MWYQGQNNSSLASTADQKVIQGSQVVSIHHLSVIDYRGGRAEGMSLYRHFLSLLDITIDIQYFSCI